MAILTAAAILASAIRKTKTVKVPALGKGAEVVLIEWSVGVAEEIGGFVNNQMQASNLLIGLKSLVVARTVIDPETREPLLTPEQVAGMSREAVDALFKEACLFNNFGSAVEELEKND